MDGHKVVLVTGASSGFGKVTAGLLAERGHSVFGTSRKPSEAEPIPGVEMLELDVRSDDSVNTCLNAVLRKTARLDVLVNNAGYALSGAVEETSIEEMKAQFDANIFGVHRLTRAALAVMRKQLSGRIINIGSVAGFAAGPFMGIYAATKFALEGYSEALRIEVKPFHVGVSLIEVGFARTNLGRNSQYPARQIEDYDPWRKKAIDSMARHIEQGTEPRLVAERVLRIVESKKPRLRYRVGREAIGIAFGRWISPDALFEQTLKKYFDVT